MTTISVSHYSHDLPHHALACNTERHTTTALSFTRNASALVNILKCHLAWALLVSVNFKVTYKRDQDGGLKQPTVPSSSSSWTDLGLGTNFTVPDTASEGSTFTIWVKATDVLGNVKVDRTQVHFDDTPPEVEKFEFSMNSAAQNVDFASK